ncbi:MAG: sugar phosphate isomerase/epimerase [Firmicutes bacterium]|nr:sugar phosphate isomerase/epimerase [Bacillota bacterium]
MKYSVSNWIYGDESLEATLARLSRYGYDGVQLMGEPRVYDPCVVNRLCQEHGQSMLSIADMYPWPTDSRDLANPDPVIRYETSLVTNVRDGLKFVSDVDSPAVKLHLDTFHMNIEESDPAGAVLEAEDLLINVHIADSNRQSVGRGHFDFRALMRSLKQIGYERALALEPLPPVPDPYMAARMQRFKDLRDVYARESIERLRAIEMEV